MNIAILGLGAIGAITAWKLQQQGHKVFNIRNACSLEIQQHNQANQTLNIEAWKEQTLDWLIICTKAGQTLEAIEAIKPKQALVEQILCIQNGMGQHQKLAKEVNNIPIWAGVSTDGAYRVNQKTVCYAAAGQTLIGAVAHTTKANADTVPNIFELAEKIELIMLNKLAVNAVINPLTSYLKCTNGELLSDKHKAEFVKLCHEIQTLYEALGWPVIEPFIQRVAQVAHQTKSNRSSSLQDVLVGRKTELAYINGYLIEQAKHINHPMPLSEFYLKALAH